MTLGYGEQSAGGIELGGAKDFDALLMSRLDFEIRVLDIPPVPDRDIEGLIGLRLRSVYPGNPRDTAFDYRVLRKGTTGRAVVFISRRSTVDAYRRAAGRRPLLLPYLLVRRVAPRKGAFRAWVCGGRWTEHLVFRDGDLVSSSARRLARGRRFDLAQEEERLAPEERTGRLVVVARQEDLGSLRMSNGAATVSFEHLPVPRRGSEGIFAARKRRAPLSPVARLLVLGGAVLLLGLGVFFKLVRSAEAYDALLRATARGLQRSNQEVRALQKEVSELAARVRRLEASEPRDAYLLLSELSTLLGENVRIRTLVLNDDAFQIQATGTNPLRLMEAFAARASFSGMKLSQVVPDPRTGMELFSISGGFHAR